MVTVDLVPGWEWVLPRGGTQQVWVGGLGLQASAAQQRPSMASGPVLLCLRLAVFLCGYHTGVH